MAEKNKVTVNKDFFIQLGDEMKNLQNDIGNYVAKEASRRLSDVATEGIKEFYDDYAPKKYRRHYQFEKKAFKPYRNWNVRNGKYYGGIRLTPELFDDVYEIDKYKVYGMVMGCVIGGSSIDNPDMDFESVDALGGYHGPLSIFNDDPPPTRPDTISQILDELDSIYDDGNFLLQEGLNYSKSKRKYKILENIKLN